MASNTSLPPWQQLHLSSTKLQSLTDTSHILLLLHHRSKNQHRRSVWYRHFSTFRKHVSRLLPELNPRIPADALPSQKLVLYDRGRRNAEKRLRLWGDLMVTKWWTAFRQLVGDSQFAVIGIVLLGCLGRVVKVMGVLGMMKVDRAALEKEVIKAVEEMDNVDIGVALGRFETDDVSLEDDNLGVKIERIVEDDVVDEPSKTAGDITALPNDGSRKADVVHDSPTLIKKSTQPRKKPPCKIKKKRNGDEIDDIFGALF